ncbi:MAG: DUF4199 domain-containing protein [Bacteroidota bacterium]
MNKNSITSGVILGIAGIISFMIGVLADLGIVGGIGLFILIIAIAVIIPIIYVRKERTENGGSLTFAQGFKVSFLGLVLGGLIGLVFQILYVQVIDPAYAEEAVVKAVEMTAKFTESLSEEDQLEQLRVAEERARGQVSLPGQLMSFGFGLILYLVISLIVAASLKRNDPKFTTDG